VRFNFDPLLSRSEKFKLTRCLIDDLEAIFLDYGIGEHFLGDALQLLLGLIAIPAIEMEHKEFSLADVFDGGVAETGQGVLDGLALGIEDGAFRHDPDMSFHEASIASGQGARADAQMIEQRKHVLRQ
jgi:hypothetical protein